MKTLEIVIPCEPASGPDRVAPVLVYLGVDATGAVRSEYKCPHCGRTNPRLKPLRNHMGLNMNMPANCPALKKQDQARRETGKQVSGNLY